MEPTRSNRCISNDSPGISTLRYKRHMTLFRAMLFDREKAPVLILLEDTLNNIKAQYSRLTQGWAERDAFQKSVLALLRRLFVWCTETVGPSHPDVFLLFEDILCGLQEPQWSFDALRRGLHHIIEEILSSPVYLSCWGLQWAQGLLSPKAMTSNTLKSINRARAAEALPRLDASRKELLKFGPAVQDLLLQHPQKDDGYQAILDTLTTYYWAIIHNQGTPSHATTKLDAQKFRPIMNVLHAFQMRTPAMEKHYRALVRCGRILGSDVYGACLAMGFLLWWNAPWKVDKAAYPQKFPSRLLDGVCHTPHDILRRFGLSCLLLEDRMAVTMATLRDPAKYPEGKVPFPVLPDSTFRVARAVRLEAMKSMEVRSKRPAAGFGATISESSGKRQRVPASRDPHLAEKWEGRAFDTKEAALSFYDRFVSRYSLSNNQRKDWACMPSTSGMYVRYWSRTSPGRMMYGPFTLRSKALHYGVCLPYAWLALEDFLGVGDELRCYTTQRELFITEDKEQVYVAAWRITQSHRQLLKKKQASMTFRDWSAVFQAAYCAYILGFPRLGLEDFLVGWEDSPPCLCFENLVAGIVSEKIRQSLPVQKKQTSPKWPQVPAMFDLVLNDDTASMIPSHMKDELILQLRIVPQDSVSVTEALQKTLEVTKTKEIIQPGLATRLQTLQASLSNMAVSRMLGSLSQDTD